MNSETYGLISMFSLSSLLKNMTEWNWVIDEWVVFFVSFFLRNSGAQDILRKNKLLIDAANNSLTSIDHLWSSLAGNDAPSPKLFSITEADISLRRIQSQIIQFKCIEIM